jgi:hypothetical protein
MLESHGPLWPEQVPQCTLLVPAPGRLVPMIYLPTFIGLFYLSTHSAVPGTVPCWLHHDIHTYHICTGGVGVGLMQGLD